MQIPDLTQRVVGFRQWNVKPDGSLLPVGTPGMGAWKPGIQQAQCWANYNSMRISCLPVVNDVCHCGFYALHRLRDAAGYGGVSGRDTVQGIVTGWGRVAVHDTGFRAEYIELMAIILPPNVKDRTSYRKAATKYNVPLLKYENAESFSQEFGASIPNSLKPIEDEYDEDLYLIDDDRSLSELRQIATSEARRLLSDDLPQWLIDVANEIDPDVPEAMAGLYDIYVPNMGDLLLAIVEPPTPSYIAFPPDPVVPATIDFTRHFTEFICTNGAIAYLPR